MNQQAGELPAVADAAILWNAELGIWEFSDMDLAQKVLRDPDFKVIDFRDVYGEFTRRFGIDFSATLSVLDMVPLGLDGEAHRDARRASTMCIRQRKDDALLAFETRFLAGLADVRPGVTVNMVTALVGPSVAAMMGTISGVTGSLTEPPTISQIFDARLSLNRRKRIEAKVAAMLAETRGTMPDDDALSAVALYMVGADSIHATLGVSLLHDIARSSGRPLNTFGFSAVPQITGVPYVDRIAAKDTKLYDVRIGRGERIRVRMNATDGTGDPEKFGIGAHVCVGKALSLSAWEIATRLLGQMPFRLTLDDATRRPADYLFNALETLNVRFT